LQNLNQSNSIMKEVLLISNLDLHADYIMQYASQFCAHYSCKLHIIHFEEGLSPTLVSSSIYYDKIGYSIDTFERQVDLITKIKKLTSQYLQTDWLNVSIRDENESIFLQEFLNDTLIDLIIVGQHVFKADTNHLSQQFKHILSNITTSPMLVIPSLEVFKPYHKCNYLLQIMNEDNIQHIKQFCTLFKGSELTLTHVEQSSKDKIAEWTEKKWMTYIHQNINQKINYESLQMKYNDYINRENYAITHIFDLLVFSTSKRSLWQRIFAPSTTLKVLTNLEMPALVFKNLPESDSSKVS